MKRNVTSIPPLVSGVSKLPFRLYFSCWRKGILWVRRTSCNTKAPPGPPGNLELPWGTLLIMEEAQGWLHEQNKLSAGRGWRTGFWTLAWKQIDTSCSVCSTALYNYLSSRACFKWTPNRSSKSKLVRGGWVQTWRQHRGMGERGALCPPVPESAGL